MPIPGAQLSLRHDGTVITTAETSGSGAFSLTASPGTYELRIASSRESGVSHSAEPAGMELIGAQVSLMENLEEDLTLPVHLVSVHVHSESDVPVEGVTISGNAANGDELANGTLAPGITATQALLYENETTDSSGIATISVPDYQDAESLEVRPPEGSGFAATYLDFTNVSEDETKELTLAGLGSSPPEYGRCSSVGSGKGKYKTSSCLSLHAGGAYEWSPKAVKSGLAITAGKVVLETIGKAKISCNAGVGVGDYSGAKVVGHLRLVLTECSHARVTCASIGASSGEIRSSELESVLQWESVTERKVLSNILPSEHSGLLLSFACGSTRYEIRGDVLARTTANKMAIGNKLTLSAKKGVQAQRAYETTTGEKIPTALEVSTNGGPFEQAGLSATMTVASEESLEINTVV